MTSNSLPVAVRILLNRWVLAIAVVCLILALVGGYVAYGAHLGEEETRIEEHTAGTWTVDSEFEHAAVAERSAAVFRSGDRLENRPLYFTSVSPEIRGTYSLTHENTDGDSAVASAELSMVVRAVEEIDGQTAVHWEERETLDSLSGIDIGDGDEATVTVSIDVPETLERIETIEADLEAAPGETEVLLVAETAVETDVAGETFTDTRTDRLEIDPGPAVYRVATTVEGPQPYDATEQVRVTVEPSLLALYGGPLLVLVGVVGVVGLATALWRDELAVTERERTRYEFETAREDFDEWVSGSEIPDIADRTTVRANSLADLVDIAIDSDRRVLEDGTRYAVLVGDIVYTYTAPPRAETPESEPLDAGDTTAVGVGSSETAGTDEGAVTESDTIETDRSGPSTAETERSESSTAETDHGDESVRAQSEADTVVDSGGNGQGSRWTVEIREEADDE